MSTETTEGAQTPTQATPIQSILAIVQAWLPVLTIVGGALWGLFTYLDHQKEVQVDAARQAAKDASVRKIEAQQPFLKQQLTLYFEAAQVAGRFTTLKPGSAQWDVNESRFWQLYWSELSMVESEAVEAAMVNLSKALPDYKRSPDNQEAIQALDESVYELAHAIRAGIESAWGGSGR